jgi:hypothetical protein
LCQCTSTILIMIQFIYVIYYDLKSSVLSMLFTACQSYKRTNSCSPSNLSSLFLAWFSHLHLILYARLPKFLCPVVFFTVSIFLIPISPLIFGNFLPRTSSLHLCFSGHFYNGWDSLFSPMHRKHFPPSVTPPRPLCYQIPSRKHGTPLLSFIVQQDM